MIRRRRLTPAARLPLTLLLFALLAGCGGLLPNPPERQMYRARARAAVPQGLPRVAAQLVVAVPSALGDLDTRRIALTRSPQSFDYFADAEWTDRLPFLVQAALVESFARSGALAAVAPEELGVRADFVLETTIADFEAHYDSLQVPPRVLVRLNVALVALPDRSIVAQTSLTGVEPAAKNTVPAVVDAFDAALGRAVRQVVAWTATNPALSARSGSVISRTRFVRHRTGRAE